MNTLTTLSTFINICVFDLAYNKRREKY